MTRDLAVAISRPEFHCLARIAKDVPTVRGPPTAEKQDLQHVQERTNGRVAWSVIAELATDCRFGRKISLARSIQRELQSARQLQGLLLFNGNTIG